MFLLPPTPTANKQFLHFVRWIVSIFMLWSQMCVLLRHLFWTGVFDMHQKRIFDHKILCFTLWGRFVAVCLLCMSCMFLNVFYICTACLVLHPAILHLNLSESYNFIWISSRFISRNPLDQKMIREWTSQRKTATSAYVTGTEMSSNNFLKFEQTSWTTYNSFFRCHCNANNFSDASGGSNNNHFSDASCGPCGAMFVATCH